MGFLSQAFNNFQGNQPNAPMAMQTYDNPLLQRILGSELPTMQTQNFAQIPMGVLSGFGQNAGGQMLPSENAMMTNSPQNIQGSNNLNQVMMQPQMQNVSIPQQLSGAFPNIRNLINQRIPINAMNYNQSAGQINQAIGSTQQPRVR